MIDFGGDTSGLMALEKKMRGVARKATFKEIGVIVAAQVQAELDAEFRFGHGPNGAAWAPKSELSSRGPTLVGESLSATAKAVYASGTVTATIGGWSAVHQRGVTIFPKRSPSLSWVAPGGRVFAKKVTIPARPMVPGDAELPAAWDASMQRAAGFKIEELLR